MKHNDTGALEAQALDPAQSVVVAACAGSGKTWLLVSRIVRLLLDGTEPGEILAITFTRQAAQEMAARLREWLALLAAGDEALARGFLRERGLSDDEIDTSLMRSRGLYEQVLSAQPPLTITTFHSWFLQILRSAPLDAGAVGNITLTEQTSALIQEAWELFAATCQRDPGCPARIGLDALFREYGLHNTRRLLLAFVEHRADWWAYAGRDADAIEQALARQAAQMSVSPQLDVLGELFADPSFAAQVRQLATLMSMNTPTDRARAEAITQSCAVDPVAAFDCLRRALLNGGDDPRIKRPSAVQASRLGIDGERRYLQLHECLAVRVRDALNALAEQASFRANAAGLAAAVALLDHYQRLKDERQVVDFADVEWLAYELLARGEHAVSMQFKLDSRYRHILLDEFQDTNPLQWLTLKAWFEAAAQADSPPVVFLVGDPKQAIYRFRRAEPRLFDAARNWLQARHGAVEGAQHESRRCAQALLDVVNRVFTAEPAFAPFALHSAHYAALPGRVEVLALACRRNGAATGSNDAVALRDPLIMARRIDEDLRREREAQHLVERLREIVARWEIIVDVHSNERRAASYGDVMVLVRRRTHLEIYERALRHAGVPFITSRQGGLLDTLEASDLIALLEFLISPFDDLKLAHALRSPIFGCTDEELSQIAGAAGGSWWARLVDLPLPGPSSALGRARDLLARWLERADRLPVHDHLDRIYFEGDVVRRYAAAVPPAMRASVIANLHAFIQRALDVDSGRYPSLPRFVGELREMQDAPAEEAPDEGTSADTGNAVRILTVHGAKGLEAPIVWLLDAAAVRPVDQGYAVLVDWPPSAESPASFSLCTRMREYSAAQRRQLRDEAILAEREDLNLLYVAMTRARQALIVSGCENPSVARSWYARIRAAVAAAAGQADTDGTQGLSCGDELVGARGAAIEPELSTAAMQSITSLQMRAPLPTGRRSAPIATRGQRYGTTFHLLMEQVTAAPGADASAIATRLGLPPGEIAPLFEQARRLIAMPDLSRFFDRRCYRRAFNELALITQRGELRRLDRVVEFDEEVWVLDYKTGSRASVEGTALENEYRLQVGEYCAALRGVFPAKAVHAALLFADGSRIEVEVESQAVEIIRDQD